MVRNGRVLRTQIPEQKTAHQAKLCLPGIPRRGLHCLCWCHCWYLLISSLRESGSRRHRKRFWAKKHLSHPLRPDSMQLQMPAQVSCFSKKPFKNKSILSQCILYRLVNLTSIIQAHKGYHIYFSNF